MKKQKHLPLPEPSAMDVDDLKNPHAEAQDFLKRILRHGSQLPASLQQLVGILRDTLPLASIIDTLREKVEKGEDILANDVGIDAFPKGAGWYRITYGDSRYAPLECCACPLTNVFRHRYALDLRSMTSCRVAILDASLPITNPAVSLKVRSRPPPKGKGKAMKTSSLGVAKDIQDDVVPSSPPIGVLLPIPNFATLLLDAIHDTIDADKTDVASGEGRNSGHAKTTLKKTGIVPVDSGIICNVNAVSKLVPLVHERILKSLASSETRSSHSIAPAGLTVAGS